jgi:AcrR family transcriptional regulator
LRNASHTVSCPLSHTTAAARPTSARIDQIADTADIAQTTFFNYFPAKADLVNALVGRLVQQFNQLVDDAHNADSSVIRRIEALFRRTAELTESQHRVLRDLIAETVRSPRRDPEQSLTHLRDVFAADIAAGQARGDVRRDRDPASLADAVLGLYVSVLLFWSTDADYPVADRLATSAELAVDLITPRGERAMSTRPR